uniref:Non-structural maintenance of chromosomes element 4 n=2 Tax=Pararge aegeria TaxID=116150 RepID=S4PH42_9NEOP
MSGVSESQPNSSYTSHEKRFLFGALTQEVMNISEQDNVNTEENLKRLDVIIDTVVSEAPNVNNSLYTGDYYIHSKALKDTSELTKRCTEGVTGEVDNYDKFALANHIENYPDFWDFMFPGEVPSVSYLFGTFAPTPLEQRPRAPRKRVERQRARDLKAPQKIVAVKQPDEGSERVKQVLRFLKKNYRSDPVSYFHVVLDPTCFTRTVENIYNVSFLARDGLVSVTLDQRTGLPFLARISDEKKRRAEPTREENQFIVSMDMERWQDLIQAFGIREPLMTW